MKSLKLALFASMLMVGTMFVPKMRAAEYNKLTKLTFNKPVEVPGMVLSPGTYVFVQLDPLLDPSAVGIFDAKDLHELTIVPTVQAERMAPTSKPVVTFEERTANSPEAINTWYYPGDSIGFQFLYPNSKTTNLNSLPKVNTSTRAKNG